MIRLAPALLLPLCLAACDKRGAAPAGGTSAAPTTTATATAQKTRLVLNWVPEPEFGGWYAARETGAYAKHNLEVEITGGGAGVPVVQMVAGGQADFGIAGADEILMARGRGVDIVPLFATYQTSPQGLMVHEARGTKTLADVLSSGTLAIEPGLPYALWLKKKYGFAKVKVVPYDGGIARFLKDPTLAQQCYVTSEPIAAKKAGSDPKVYLVADDGFNPYLGVVIARRTLLDEKPALVKAFLAATREGWSAYLADPKPANAIMGKLNPAMTPETFAAAAEAQHPLVETAATKAGGVGVMERARWDTLAAQLLDIGVLDKPLALPPDFLRQP